MKIAIKSKPEDFIVEEVANLLLKKRGAFSVYHLRKQGWNTIDLLHHLAAQLKIPFTQFAYGGRKDRHALTTQFISIQAPRISNLKQKDYSLEFAGFMDRPMGPDLIEGNRFAITIRRLTASQIAQASARLEFVRQSGLPNYFDDQRFGSFDPQQGFLAQKIISNHLNGAIKIYLIAIGPQDRKEDKERKKYFADHWRDWKACAAKAKTVKEEEAFAILEKSPNDFVTILRSIPREELSIFYSAYEGFIWNEILRDVLKIKEVQVSLKYPGIAGDYFFYEECTASQNHYFQTLLIPTMAAVMKYPDEEVRLVYERIFKEHGISKTSFNRLKIRHVYFKSFLRPAIVVPTQCSIETLAEESSMILKFVLPRGSYGTMLLKKLFSDPI